MDAIAPCSARGIAPRFWRFCPARLAWRAAASHACGECGAAVVREPWATRGRPKARGAADCARRESNPGHKLRGLYDAAPLRAPRALRSSPLLRWAARRRCERAANANALRQRVCLSVLAEETKRERERERERPDNLADQGPSARRTAVRQLAHTIQGRVVPKVQGRATGPLPRR